MPQTSSSTTKIVLSSIFIVAIVGYVVWQSMHGSPVVVTTPEGTTSQPTETTNPSASAALYKDGSYTGPATDAFYGTVQVKAVVKSGRLADVQFLQYPNDRAHSLEVSNQSMPILTQEAITAQSAEVDTVSGATQTSDAFKTSLTG